MNEWIGPGIQVCAPAGSIHCEKKTPVRFFFSGVGPPHFGVYLPAAGSSESGSMSTSKFLRRS
jgi:hypothetical protein